MRFLLAIFLTLFVSQMVISNVQILNSNSEEEITYDLQEEDSEEDSEESSESEKEDSEKESDEDEKERSKDFILDPLSDYQSKLLESHFKQSIYPSVVLNTPCPPPDMNC